MSSIIFFLLFLIFFASSTTSSSSKSYGEMAQTEVLKFYNQMITQLSSLTIDSLPNSVKTLRKSILGSRNMLDVFIYAYPNNTKKGDLCLKIRKHMNQGYEAIGAFQDLDHSGVPYSHSDLVNLRSKCLTWKSDFIRNDKLETYYTYLRNPSILNLFVRPNDINPGYFWKQAGIIPELSNSGIQNIAHMTAGLLGVTITHYPDVIQLEDIFEPSQQEIYHSYRKLSRSILYIRDFFLEIFDKKICPNITEGMVEVEKIYDVLGNLNDEYVQYQFYLNKGETKAAEEAKQTLLKSWGEIVTELEGDDVIEKLKCLYSSVGAEK